MRIWGPQDINKGASGCGYDLHIKEIKSQSVKWDAILLRNACDHTQFVQSKPNAVFLMNTFRKGIGFSVDYMGDWQTKSSLEKNFDGPMIDWMVPERGTCSRDQGQAPLEDYLY